LLEDGLGRRHIHEFVAVTIRPIESISQGHGTDNHLHEIQILSKELLRRAYGEDADRLRFGTAESRAYVRVD
jgi:hypothetical protein